MLRGEDVQKKNSHNKSILIENENKQQKIKQMDANYQKTIRDKQSRNDNKYLVLTTNIPNSEANVLIFNSLNVKTCKSSVKCKTRDLK